MQKPTRSRRFQFRLVNWFWVTLVVAVFFLGRNWHTITPFQAPARTGSPMFGMGVTSDAGVTGAIVIDQANFYSSNIESAGAEPGRE